MSAVAERMYEGASVFAAQLRYQGSNAATTQHADVFARRQRIPPAVSLPEPKRSAVDLPIGHQIVRLTYLDFGTGLPSWAQPVLLSLSERWGVGPGWDSYDAKPTDLQHAVELLNYLSDLMRDSSKPPVITPLPDGGLQAEWHRNEQDLEIMVLADESVRYYYYNGTTEEEREEELDTQHFEQVRTLIARF